MSNKKKTVKKRTSKTSVKKVTVGKQFQQKRGAIWKKKDKNDRSMLSIIIDEKNYFGFTNSRKLDAKGKVRVGMEKMPDYFVSMFEDIKNKRYQIDCGGVWKGQSKNKKIKDMLWILMEQRFIALPNPFKTSEGNRQPDYLIYLAYANNNKIPAWRSKREPRLIGSAKSVKKIDPMKNGILLK